MKKLLLGGFLCIGIVIFMGGSVHAATFEVNTEDNGFDINPGDGLCETASADCTLHAAIEEANALVGQDDITFNIPGAGVHTIMPISALPQLGNDLLIDGSTQPGASCGTLVPSNKSQSNIPHNILIEIDGSLMPSNIIEVNASAFVDIRGLSLHSAQTSYSSIDMQGGSEIQVSCNLIGTDASGNNAPANNGSGISDTNVSGLTVTNNLISGNLGGAGIFSNSAGDTDISGNLIGTTINGMVPLGNDSGIDVRDYNANITNNVISGNNLDGIYLRDSAISIIAGNLVGVGLQDSQIENTRNGIYLLGSTSATIGGTTSAERNVISNNGQSGINIENNCSLWTVNGIDVLGNYIGTDSNGNFDGYGNQDHGLVVGGFENSCESINRVQIGGPQNNQQNLIAGNGGSGIMIYQETNSQVYSVSAVGNIIHNNGGIAIDLATDSVLNNVGIPNTDIGLNSINRYSISLPNSRANHYLNHPEINSSTTYNGKLTINYDFSANLAITNNPGINSDDLVGFRLDFYANKLTSGFDSGNGQHHIGSFIVDGSESSAVHKFDIDQSWADYDYVSGTATVLWKDLGNFAACNEKYGEGIPYALGGCES